MMANLTARSLFLHLGNFATILIAVLLLISVGIELDRSTDDFKQYWQAAINIRDANDPYATTRTETNDPSYPNPPLLAYLVVLMLPLGFKGAQVVWFLFNTISLIGLLWICFRLVRSANLRQYWGSIVGVIVFAPATYLCLNLGQLGIVLILLITGSFVLSRRYPILAGAALALASSIKIYPGLFLLYYLVHGPRRVVWSSVFSGLLLFTIPIIFSGTQPYTAYINKVLLGNFYPYPAEFNISIVGFWSRLLVANRFVIAPLLNAPALKDAIILITALLLLGACIRARSASDDLGRVIIFSIWICSMLLLTPLNGYYNLIGTVLPAFTLLRCLELYPSRPATLLLSIATLCLYIHPGWARTIPWLWDGVHTGWGLLVLTPSLFGVGIYLALLLMFARRHADASLSSVPQAQQTTAYSYTWPQTPDS